MRLLPEFITVADDGGVDRTITMAQAIDRGRKLAEVALRDRDAMNRSFVEWGVYLRRVQQRLQHGQFRHFCLSLNIKSRNTARMAINMAEQFAPDGVFRPELLLAAHKKQRRNAAALGVKPVEKLTLRGAQIVAGVRPADKATKVLHGGLLTNPPSSICWAEPSGALPGRSAEALRPQTVVRSVPITPLCPEEAGSDDVAEYVIPGFVPRPLVASKPGKPLTMKIVDGRVVRNLPPQEPSAAVSDRGANVSGGGGDSAARGAGRGPVRVPATGTVQLTFAERYRAADAARRLAANIEKGALTDEVVHAFTEFVRVTLGEAA